MAIVLSLVIVRVACKRNQTTNRPPVVSYTIPWVGSALDLGKDPDAFLKRAMYVEQLFPCLDAEDDPPPRLSAQYGDMFTVKAFGRSITYVTSPRVREFWNILPRSVSVDLF